MNFQTLLLYFLFIVLVIVLTKSFSVFVGEVSKMFKQRGYSDEYNFDERPFMVATVTVAFGVLLFTVEIALFYLINDVAELGIFSFKELLRELLLLKFGRIVNTATLLSCASVCSGLLMFVMSFLKSKKK